MPLSIPTASRILPLTKQNFDELLAVSEHTGKVCGYCTKYIAPPTEQRAFEPEDEGDIMDLLAEATEGADFLLHPHNPDRSQDYGARYMTFYHHPELTTWMKKSAFVGNFGLSLEFTTDGVELEARITSNCHPRLKERVFRAPFAADTEAEIRWTEPPHDPEFLRRVMPALYRDQEEAFTWGEWFMRIASTPADGICILHGRTRLMAVLDRDRYPIGSENTRILEEARAVLIELLPEEQGDKRAEKLIYLNRDVELYAEKLLQTLTAQFGITLPHPIKRRWFFWQTYLEGIKRPGWR